MDRISNQTIYLSKEGIENLNFQKRAYEKSKTRQPLTEAEEKVVNRIHEGEENAKKYAKNMEDAAVSICISTLGLEKAEDLQNLTELDHRFVDSLDMCDTLLEGIDSNAYASGAVVDVLADNYKEQLEQLSTQYSDREYEYKMAVLNKAFDEASHSAQIGYSRYIRIMTGDLKLPSGRLMNYSSQAESDRAYAAEQKTEAAKEPIADKKMIADIQQEFDGALKEIKNLMLFNYQNRLTPRIGYAAEFDEISKGYAEALLNHDYDTAANMDILSVMEEKYQSLKAEIEETYSGEEREEKLTKLEKEYMTVWNDNVTKPMEVMLENATVVNKIRKSFAECYEKAAKVRGENAVKAVYGDLSGWKKPISENEKLLENYQSMTEQLKQMFQNINGFHDNMDQAIELFRNINLGLRNISANNQILAK